MYILKEDVPEFIAINATHEAMEQLPSATEADILARAEALAAAIFERLHTPVTLH